MRIVDIPEIVGKITPLGHVNVELDRDGGRVVVSMRPSTGIALNHFVSERDGVTYIEFTRKDEPSPGHEVTINGKTIEVVRVEHDDSGAVWLYPDNGEKVRWA